MAAFAVAAFAVAAFAVAAFAVAAFAVAATAAPAAGEVVAGVVLLLASVAADAPAAVSTQSAAVGATIHRMSFGLAFHAARAFEGKPTITTFLSPYLTSQDQRKLYCWKVSGRWTCLDNLGKGASWSCSTAR